MLLVGVDHRLCGSGRGLLALSPPQVLGTTQAQETQGPGCAQKRTTISLSPEVMAISNSNRGICSPPVIIEKVY